MNWKNDDLVLYHGCSDASLQPGNPRGIGIGTTSHGIKHEIGRDRLDFGRGFYTTTWLYQARLWANDRQIIDAKHRPTARAVVLRIEMKRNDLADLQCLGFVDWKRSGWLPFIDYCRAGGRPHAPAQYRAHPYDVVYGPLSGASSRLPFGEADQMSFHTDEATKKILAVSIHEFGTPLLVLGDP